MVKFFVTLLYWLVKIIGVREANINRLDTKPQNSSSSKSLVTHPFPETVRRLIVLVPDGDFDAAAATGRVWELANNMAGHIQFVGLCKDEIQESTLRRQLVIMTAMVQDGNVSAEANVEFGNNWVNVGKSNWHEGDMIVCFAEQRAGLLHRPLSQILQSNLNFPVYILSGLYPQSPSRLKTLSFIPLWAGFLSILAVSFLLQIRIIALPEGWSQTTLLIISVTAELWLIWVWNNLFS